MLSLLFFIIIIIIMVIEIWQLQETHDSISGIAIGQMYYLALYADDTIVFLRNTK